MPYYYESHYDEYYKSNKKLCIAYCELCNDIDRELGYFENDEEFLKKYPTKYEIEERDE